MKTTIPTWQLISQKLNSFRINKGRIRDLVLGDKWMPVCVKAKNLLLQEVLMEEKQFKKLHSDGATSTIAGSPSANTSPSCLIMSMLNYQACQNSVLDTSFE